MATPNERSALASAAAHARWAKEDDRAGATAKARENSPASIEYWMRKIDPQERMPRTERLKRAGNAKAAYWKAHALKMRQAKARKAAEAAA
ncbi:hypothetical protein [Nonomuraea pusilla]|uniref:Uncharacterized protein n=1 Tax=Nonomuraea pusilla TaxID=46177 RepID=A0A1H8KBH9_9ACTN|nr:hypothetical protein [Nonomuraea pusilla]SEN90362.1 hypothetical protein SAMN05660976_08571 [Nonomuraea pusilla]